MIKKPDNVVSVGALTRILPLLLVLALIPTMTLLAAETGSSGPARWTIVREKSGLTFEATQNSAPFKGRLPVFDGDILFSPDDLPSSAADISIDMNAIDTQDKDRDEYARGAEWLNIAAFPAAKFRTTEIANDGKNSYHAKGNLTIRDKTLPVSFLFTLVFSKDPGGNETATMDGKLTINRLDFGVGQGQWQDTNSVGNAVNITIHLVALKSR